MTISLLPTPPSRAQSPELFADAADAFLSALPAFGTEANALATEVNAAKVAAAASAADAAAQVGLAEDQVALVADQVSLATAEANAAAAAAASALNAPGTSAFATDSLTIGLGTKALTIQTGKAYTVGQFVIAASAGNPGNYMIGQITAYNAGTGSLVLTVTSTGGNGTYADWNIALTAPADASTVAGGMEATTTATSFTLSTTAKRLQVITFTADGQSVTLPDATALPLGGELYVIENAGEYPFAVRDSAGTLQTIIQPGQIGAAYLKDNSTAAGSWVFGSMKGGELGGFRFGTAVLSTSTGNTYLKCVWLTDTTAFLMAGNGTVRYTIATVSGGTISFSTLGTLSSFTNNTANQLIKLTSTLLVHWNSGTMRAISISGTTATLGTAATVSIGHDGGVVRVADTAFMAYYQGSSNYYTSAQVYTVSGTTITPGTSDAVVVTSTSKQLYAAQMSESKTVIPFYYSGGYRFKVWDTTPTGVTVNVATDVQLLGLGTLTTATTLMLGMCKSGPNEFVVITRDTTATSVPPMVRVYSFINSVISLKHSFFLDIPFTTENVGYSLHYLRDGVVLFGTSAVDSGSNHLYVIKTTGAYKKIRRELYGATTYSCGISVNVNGVGLMGHADANISTTRVVNTFEVA